MFNQKSPPQTMLDFLPEVDLASGMAAVVLTILCLRARFQSYFNGSF